jgi:hypothetical protein
MQNTNCREIADKYRALIADFERFKTNFKEGKNIAKKRTVLLSEARACVSSVEDVRGLIPGYFERYLLEFGKKKEDGDIKEGVAENFFKTLFRQGHIFFKENPYLKKFPQEVVDLIRSFSESFVFEQLGKFQFKITPTPFYFDKDGIKEDGTVTNSHSQYYKDDVGAQLHGGLLLVNDDNIGAVISATVRIIAFFENPEKSVAVVSVSASNTRPFPGDPDYGCPDCNGFGCWSCNFSGGF